MQAEFREKNKSSSAPTRIFIHEALDYGLNSSKTKDVNSGETLCPNLKLVRIMGVVISKNNSVGKVDKSSLSSWSTPSSNISNDNNKNKDTFDWSCLIDDGTGIIKLQQVKNDQEIINVEKSSNTKNNYWFQNSPPIGQTIDCVGYLNLPKKIINKRNNQSKDDIYSERVSENEINHVVMENETRPKIHLLYFSNVMDPNAFTLRMLELISIRRRREIFFSQSTNTQCMCETQIPKKQNTTGSKYGDTANNGGDGVSFGSIGSMFGTFYENEENQLCINDQHILKFIKSSSADGGVTIDELKLVLQCSSNEMELMINTLQKLHAGGEIYQGMNGEYLPL